MDYLFILAIIIVAFLYSSVGHGGASGYLALMALFGIAPSLMKSSALIMNLFVAGIAFIAYYRGGHFNFRLLLPFIIGSIPMAFIGASIQIDATVYKIILGSCLLLAVLRLTIINYRQEKEVRKLPFLPACILGAFIGLISGMIGIGGGIILSPLLILMRWATFKQAATASALFIFLNSLAGLAGLISNGLNLNTQIFIWIMAGVSGALTGSFMGSFKFENQKLKYILASVLLFAVFKLYLF
jgi:uncharacterized protein